MKEIIFNVEQDEDGIYTASANGDNYMIVTQGDNINHLKEMVIDALDCYFDDFESEKPTTVKLHFVKEEILSYG